MFRKPPSITPAGLLVGLAVVVATGCSPSPAAVTTTSTDNLVQLGIPNAEQPVASAPPTPQQSVSSVAPGTADPGSGLNETTTTTVDAPTPADEAALASEDGEQPEQSTGADAELDLSDLDALLADLDDLLGDIDGELNDLEDSFDNDEGDVEE
ncbi:MAG: hypothetical protein DWP92_00140 [Armatimonadetes bacterium]|nr:MAG: hypothetical protein DWP92_00140 [Armatimonadota bacterium]